MKLGQMCKNKCNHHLADEGLLKAVSSRAFLLCRTLFKRPTTINPLHSARQCVGRSYTSGREVKLRGKTVRDTSLCNGKKKKKTRKPILCNQKGLAGLLHDCYQGSCPSQTTLLPLHKNPIPSSASSLFRKGQ